MKAKVPSKHQLGKPGSGTPPFPTPDSHGLAHGRHDGLSVWALSGPQSGVSQNLLAADGSLKNERPHDQKNRGKLDALDSQKSDICRAMILLISSPFIVSTLSGPS